MPATPSTMAGLDVPGARWRGEWLLATALLVACLLVAACGCSLLAGLLNDPHTTVTGSPRSSNRLLPVMLNVSAIVGLIAVGLTASVLAAKPPAAWRRRLAVVALVTAVGLDGWIAASGGVTAVRTTITPGVSRQVNGNPVTRMTASRDRYDLQPLAWLALGVMHGLLAILVARPVVRAPVVWVPDPIHDDPDEDPSSRSASQSGRLPTVASVGVSEGWNRAWVVAVVLLLAPVLIATGTAAFVLVRGTAIRALSMAGPGVALLIVMLPIAVASVVAVVLLLIGGPSARVRWRWALLLVLALATLDALVAAGGGVSAVSAGFSGSVMGFGPSTTVSRITSRSTVEAPAWLWVVFALLHGALAVAIARPAGRVSAGALASPIDDSPVS